ncbi:hypothetical protein AW061_11165 [Escherichia coli]|nr:hypothetical protein AW061_11165 [Escherichia coli]PNO91005.1 hypothetical protein RK56_024570 [Escherichia coli]PNO96115.1 hypothetical protein RK56_019205 [Escherichia coli]TJP88512.1 hypothetical protein C9Z74_10210 [Escherichia coli]
MPERCLIRDSPVTVFSDNKRHSFHPSGRVFSGRRGFFIYTANSFIRNNYAISQPFWSCKSDPPGAPADTRRTDVPHPEYFW